MLFGSCQKGFLDMNPTSQLNSGTFYSSLSNMNAALTACYGALQEPLFCSNMPYYDCLADEGYDYNGMHNLLVLERGPVTPTSGGYVDEVYANAYWSIARDNIFLNALANYSKTDISPTVKTTYEAEVRFLRALKYFDLYKFYGSVPLVLKPLDMTNQNQPKVDASLIKTQILNDLDFAIANLPDVGYSNTSGHAVKSSAQTLESRVLLFDAYNATDGSAITAVMTSVKQMTSDVIAKNYYSISPSYRGLFCDDLGFQNGNPEFVFTINFSAPLDFMYYNATGGDLPTMSNSNGQANAYFGGGEVFVLKNMANEYEFNDGSSFSTSSPLYNSSNPIANRDPRMGKTIYYGSSVMLENGFILSPQNLSTTGYGYYKHITGTDAQNRMAGLDGSDWPLMRYAEVLLNFAEAANELEGPTSEVYNAINQIRARADVMMPPLPSGLTQAQMRESIRHERRVELAFEGFRFDDLKRWRIAEQKLNLSLDEGVIPRSFVAKNYLYPLPQTQVTISNGVLVQNPNY